MFPYGSFETAVMHFLFVILIDTGIDYITAVVYLEVFIVILLNLCINVTILIYASCLQKRPEEECTTDSNNMDESGF